MRLTAKYRAALATVHNRKLSMFGSRDDIYRQLESIGFRWDREAGTWVRPGKQSLGGLAVRDNIPPAYCPRCGKAIQFGTTWHQYIGHLGLHALADKYGGGDVKKTQRHLMKNGLARLDPMPQNGAFRPYQPIVEGVQ